jgi:hypothetical protein
MNCINILSLFHGLDEVFDNETLQRFGNASLYFFREVIAPYFGKCYTACFLKSLSLNDNIMIGLKPNWNYRFYMHAKGGEIWLGGSGSFPTNAVNKILGNSLSK